MTTCDAVGAQLGNYKKARAGAPPEVLTSSTGAPVSNLTETLTVGPRGPSLMEDFAFFDHMAHFNREKMPDRIVHGKGSGAFGYFEVTRDITQYCKAKLFSTVGKKTPIGIRFSSAMSERGNPDMVRDVKGIAVKFYTEEGNWDLVGNNSPIFFIRDPMLFPSLAHALLRNPVTNMRDAEMFWDFLSSRPESTHQVMMFFSDRGIPYSYRFMHGFGANTFKMVNANNEYFFCKFHYLTNQGPKNLPVTEAGVLLACDPDFYNRDLFNCIADGNFPSWTLHVQIMTPEQAEKYPWNPFDVTKVWLHKDFPLIEVGKIVLDRNPKDFHAEVEQMAVCPSNMVPGIEASPDRLLQGRLVSYTDAQRHRFMSPNFNQLPVNAPICPFAYYQRGGNMLIKDMEGRPHYYPNSFGGPRPAPELVETPGYASGVIKRHPDVEGDDFAQPRMFWERVLKPDERERLVDNIAEHMQHVSPMIQDRAIDNFRKVHDDFANNVARLVKKKMDTWSKAPTINQAKMESTPPEA